MITEKTHCIDHSGQVAICEGLRDDMREVKSDIKKLLYKIGLLVAGTTALNTIVTLILPTILKGGQ